MTTAPARTLRLHLPDDGSSPGQTYDPALTKAIDEFQRAVMRDRILDPVTTELVRLRCARVHDCRTCSRSRFAPARSAGADEDFLAQVDCYESSSLPERQKVALRLADAHIFGSLSDRLREDVDSIFTPAEALEICLLVSKFSLQKSLVALGMDAPADDRFLVDFDADGSVVWVD